ncbi:hypothetical protein CKA32_002732 [Geitlerinema sp. FC II]|nr:hypothetical protein CKA32_002732 [Geitlerinema sp. FC II]
MGHSAIVRYPVSSSRYLSLRYRMRVFVRVVGVGFSQPPNIGTESLNCHKIRVARTLSVAIENRTVCSSRPSIFY